MCPTSWKIAGISLLVLGVGAAIRAGQGTPLEKENDDLKQPLAQARAELKAVGPNAGSSSTSPPAAAKPWHGLGAGPEDAKTKSIRQKLEAPISMSFADETPFEDVLKYIKSATRGPNDTSIPIYVDPVGMVEAEKTMTSPVSLELEGVPLRITLRLVLKQLGLTYMVRDGLLTITSERAENQPISIIEIVERAKSGELTLDEVRALTELVEAVSELDQASQKLFGGGHAKK
jgi:hypothetical protein